MKSPCGRDTPTFRVSIVVGDNMKGDSGSVGTGMRGLALIIAAISVMSVHRMS